MVEIVTWPKLYRRSVSESPQKMMKLISRFSKCHRVCGNHCEVPSVTNLLVLHVTNARKFRLNMNFLLSSIEEEINKLL